MNEPHKRSQPFKCRGEKFPFKKMYLKNGVGKYISLDNTILYCTHISLWRRLMFPQPSNIGFTLAGNKLFITQM